MTARHPPWLAVALLRQLLGNNEPLLGDLVEECPHRSRSWFWHQVMFAVLARASTGAWATVREPQRLGGVLTSLAMFVVLSFQVAVAGSLLDDLIHRLDPAQATRINHPEWLIFAVLMSLPAGWVTGRAMSRLHRHSRVATILVCGASAAAVASVTLSLLSSESSGFVFPSAGLRTAAAMAFVLALLAGGSRSGAAFARRHLRHRSRLGLP
jgi:hypothetical protein